MARIRLIEIQNFRGIKKLTWFPADGLNCLIGPGDNGKSSILDAIDFCLGARRNLQISDADFHRLEVGNPIKITITIGELDDALKSIDSYGPYLRGFDPATQLIDDEPENGAETVLTLRLTVASDLEPSWALVSGRAETQGLTRNLSWGDRTRLAPTRMGALADYHLGWRRGSVLNRVSEEKADASAALIKAARDARAAFGDEAEEQLSETLGIVGQTARELGIGVGENIRAMLDAHSVSFSDGTIALHSDEGIPLRGLGLGSMRLLIAGLQRKAAARSAAILIDELEHGLEPHRIIRLLGSLGAKERIAPLQAFMTTHSPVAVRELAGDQLFVVRAGKEEHQVLPVGTADDIQSAIRLYPDAFLAPAVIVCEGATEVGLIRGLDQHRAAAGQASISARGTALVDNGGGDPDRPFRRASAFQALRYRAAVLRDDDQKPAAQVEQAFKGEGGTIFAWRNGRALEDELFLCLPDDAITAMIDRAIELHGEELIAAHINSASQNARTLAAIQLDALLDGYSERDRQILSKAARTKKAGWFKSVSWMEQLSRDVVGPHLVAADAGFRGIVDDVFAWAANA